MPQITSIHLTLITGNASGAGTDGDVYLGICGREFFVDTTANDFERGASREYIFGDEWKRQQFFDQRSARAELNNRKYYSLSSVHSISARIEIRSMAARTCNGNI